MAEISLKVYQSKLDGLLEHDGANEVIAHSRHILTEHPKNLKAYSQMGQALFAVSRWEEAAELFRRLLGGLPYDFVAHSHLGHIYQQLGQIDDAIWHVERSYDQQPNNPEIIDRLRKLYKQHRGKDIQRLQLTAGAVAQQHIRNNLYLQAVSVLDKALRRYPNRIDLKVLRARALWLAERHLDAAEGAVDILEVLPYSLVANRILTELWLMEQRPSDAQRYLSRIEDLDPYLAYRLATGEAAPESLITLEELDYEAISRHELSTANPDWLNTIGNVESTDDVAEPPNMEDDDMSWLDEVAADAPVKKVTDDLENLLSDEWQAQVDKLDSEPISEAELDDLFGDLDDDGGLDDSDDELDDLFDGMDDDDDLEDLLGDIEDDEELQLPEGISTDDLPEGLLDRIEKMKGMSKHDTMPATNRPDVENPYDEAKLTGMLNQLDAEEEDMSWLTDVQQGEYDPSTGTLDDEEEDAVESDWLQELQDIESSPDAQRVSTGLTGMFDDEDQGDIGDVLDELDESDASDILDLFDDDSAVADPINPDDPTAWMQASGIEFSDEFEEEDDLDPFDFESEGVSIESDDVSPVAWLGGSSEADDADDMTASDPADTDPLAWMSEEPELELTSDTDDLLGESDMSDTDDLLGESDMSDVDDLFGDMEVSDTDDLFGEDVSDTDDLFADLDDSVSEPAATSDDAWLGDDAMLDEMFDLDSEDFDFELDDEDNVSSDNELADASPPHDRQDTMNDDLNNDWQSEQPDDDNDSMDWLNDDGTDEDSGGMPEFFGDLDDNAESQPSKKISSDDEVDLEDMFAQMSDEDFNEDDSGLEWLEAEELMESADDVELVIDEFDDEDEEDPLSWLNQPDTDDLSEEVAESTGMTDMLNALGGDDDEDDDEFQFDLESDDVVEEATSEEGGHWLDRVALNTDDDAPATEAEADWLADIDVDGEFGEAVGESEVEWLADDAASNFNFEAEEDGEEVADLFDFEEEQASDFDFEADSDAIVAEEPDWLSTLDTVVDGDEDAEETVAEDEDDWFPEMDESADDGDELEDIVGEQPDWLSGVARDEDSEDDAVESTDEWLSELGEFEDDDELSLELDDDDEAEAVEQPDWLSDVAVAGAGAAAAMAANEMLGDDDSDDEDGDGWLSELGEFEDEAEAEAIVDDDSNEWMAELGEFEDDDAEEVAEADLTWMTEDEAELSSETAVGATADVDYLDEVDPATAESALDWMTDADDEDEIMFDELDEQPQGITDFLNEESTDDALVEGDGSDWLSEIGDDIVEDAEEAVADEESDWLSASSEFEDEVEEAVADEEPDWLSASSEFGDEVEEVVADEEPDWLSASSEFGDEVEEAVADEEPDWLSASSEFGDEVEEAVADEADWLSDIGEDVAEEAEAVADGNYDFENDDTIVGRPDMELEEAVADEADWLSDMGEGDGVQDAFADELVDEHDWEQETSLEEAQTAEDPDWLSGMGEGDGIQDAFAQAVSEIDEFGDDSSMDDEFDELNVYETDDEDDVTYEEDHSLPELEEEEFSIEETVPSSGLADDDYLADFDEDMEHTPADDAPDWLNAMVPGLDIDYEAEEDEPVDQGFVSVAQSSTEDKGFDWLEEIVEEESQPITPIAPRPQMVTAPRFQFSKPPAWLEILQGGTGASSAAVASAVVDEEAIDFDDFGNDSIDDDEDITFAELDAIDTADDDEFAFDDFDDDSIDDDEDITFAELDALELDDEDDDDVMFGEFDDFDADDDNELTFNELDDLEDNFDTQVGSASDGDDELPDWLDFDDDD